MGIAKSYFGAGKVGGARSSFVVYEETNTTWRVSATGGNAMQEERSAHQLCKMHLVLRRLLCHMVYRICVIRRVV